MKTFKGFDFKVGDKKYRYKVDNKQKSKRNSIRFNKRFLTII